jgi:hypothetical protein
MSHVFSVEPPATDQYEEQARYECMRLVQDGRLDGPRVLSQRDDGVPWSVMRDMATPPRPFGGLTGDPALVAACRHDWLATLPPARTGPLP